MGLVINTNIASINAQRNMNRTIGALNSSLSRLSSGMRITSAKDDAAGLAISEKMKAQIRGLSQAERNANDGISMVQTAEGAMNEVSGILIRMRELAVQSSTGTLGAEERGYLNSEFKDLVKEIDRIAEVTEFNGRKLLDGTSSAGVTFQVGLSADSSDQITAKVGQNIKGGDIGADQLGLSILTTNADGTAATWQTSGSLASQSLASADGATGSLAVIDRAIKDISGARGGLGSVQNRLSITVNNLATQRENISAANSRIRDVDVADETVRMTRSQILMQAGVSVMAQANQLPSMALSLIGG